MTLPVDDVLLVRIQASIAFSIHFLFTYHFIRLISDYDGGSEE
jgi:hypothetical protein